MTLLVPNVGEGRMLKAYLNHTAGQDLDLRLYKSNTTPAETDTHATYTQATFTGYGEIALAGGTWSITEGAPSYGQYPQQTFTSSADQTQEDIYGYYLVQHTSGILMWAERFSGAPYGVSNDGDTVKVTPYIEQA